MSSRRDTFFRQTGIFSMLNRRRGSQFGLLLLAVELYQYGVHRIPPVTLGTIALNVLVFLSLPLRTTDTCISVRSVWHQGEWKRLILGSIDHLDDIHLYFNMASLLMKGISLERRFKSSYFAYLLIVFTILTSVTLVGIKGLLAHLTNDMSYAYTCSAGFSGVLFALKVLTTHYSPPGTQLLLGFIPIPSKWIYWAELFVIWIIVPNTSFTGHLAGILVGLAYIKGPLKDIMDKVYHRGPSYTYRAGLSGQRSDWTNSRGYRLGNSSTGQRSGYSNNTSRPNPSAPPENTFNSGSSPGYTGSKTPSAPSFETQSESRFRGSGTPSESRFKGSGTPSESRFKGSGTPSAPRFKGSGTPSAPRFFGSGTPSAPSDDTNYRGTGTPSESRFKGSGTPSAPRFKGSGTPSAPSDDTNYRAGGTIALTPPGWRNHGERLYPDLKAETNVNTADLSEEEQMKILLERSRWER